MKHYTLIAATLLFAAQGAQADELQDMCSTYSEAAENAASARYNGVPMRDMMAAADGMELAESLVRAAYQLPDYASERMQQRTITRFGNRTFTACLDAFGGS